MTPTKAIRISIPQAFDEPEDNEGNERRQNQSSGQGSSGIPIFRSFSISDIWNRNDGAEDVNGSKARIPSIVQSSGEVYYATPLPILSMVVLSIAMLTEFLSANVAGPFMLFMVKGFGVSAEDSETAFWTGILVAMFFLTQFLTSLIWAALAEKYSPRAVLILCLLGSALSTLAFGASDTLMVAMISRLAQGVFAGSIGVTKSSIGAVTDSSNEGRAYAILGFCWGFGGVSGAVIGGTFERPAMKWPSVFGTIPFFTDFPYMLPCMVASSIMVTGSCLAYFLGPDLGPCTGKQHLTREKITIPLPAEEADGEGSSRSIKSFRYLSKKLSGIFNNPFIPDSEERMPLLFAPHTFTQNQTTCMQDQLPTGSSTPAIHRNLTYAFTTHYHGYPLDRNQTMTMESNRSSFIGQRSARDATVNGILRRPRSNHSNRSTRISYTDIEVGTAPEDYGRLSSSAAGKRLSLIDRVVLANENAHMSGIADFWVASAISLEGSNTIDDLYDVEGDVDTHSDNDDADRGRGDTRSIFSRRSVSNQRISKLADRRPFFGRQMSDSTGFPVVSVRNNMPTSPVQTRAVAHSPIRASYFDSDSRFFPRTETVDSTNNLRVEPVLRPIIESRRMSNFYSPASDHVEEGLDEEGKSVLSEDIPMLIIMQYGLLALHSTTHDQVFMSYLVTAYEGGGLGLTAGHFAQLIALMSAFQIFYQFYLYPNVGPPRGTLSYLTLFRLGCLLYIPSYLSVILYRNAFASPNGHGNSLMLALIGSTALRYCGNTFGYTSISILLNYMTPPHALGYANGIAQSIVSLARCVGPIVGGWLWSYGTQDDPSGYYLGFVVCAAFCAVAMSHSFMLQ